MKKAHSARHHPLPKRLNGGEWIKDVILGGQDGLVNVLGIVLGVAAATSDARIVIISGMAGTFAESISMAAVAYTSSKAARDYYYSELEREKAEMEHMPQEERKEIRQIYRAKGFQGPLLAKVVNTITSNHKVWLQTMMAEELRMFPDDYEHPGLDAVVVGFSSFVGSLIPLFAFFFMPVRSAMWISLAVCAITLFITGAAKAKLTIGDWKRAGIEMMLIGMLAALAGYGIGSWLGAMPGL